MVAAAVWPLLVLILQLTTCDSTGNGAQEPVTATDPAAGIMAGYTAANCAQETALALGIVRVVGSIGVLWLAWLSAGLLLLILRVGVLVVAAAVRLLVLRLSVLRLGGVLLLLGRVLIVLRCPGSATRIRNQRMSGDSGQDWSERLTSIRHVPEGCLRHRLRIGRLVGRAESRPVAEGRRSRSCEGHHIPEERLHIVVAVAGILGCSPAVGSGRSWVGIGCMGQT